MLHALTSRRIRRVVAVCGAMVALCAAGAAPAGAIGNAGFSLSPSPNASGWITTPGATVTMRFAVDGIDISPSSGDYDEFINKIECSGTGVSGGEFDGPGLLIGNFGLVQTQVSVSGDSASPGGTGVSCTATYQRRVYSNCSIFGCASTVVNPSGSVTIGTNLRIDSSPPVNVVGHPVTGPAAGNWHNAPTVVNFAAQDPNSFVAFCTQSVPLAGPSSTLLKAASGFCRNGAGLQRSGEYLYRFDDTPPALTPTVSPDPVVRGDDATAAPNATDQHSGVASSSCATPDTSTVGAKTVTCTAKDVATNEATADAEYRVVYDFAGFAAPVDATGVNVTKAGQAIPLKFSVSDADGPVTDLSGVTVKAVSMPCDLGETEDQLEEQATGGSGLQHLGGGAYQFNWKSPKEYATSCKTLRLDVGDGVAHEAAFRFTK